MSQTPPGGVGGGTGARSAGLLACATLVHAHANRVLLFAGRHDLEVHLRDLEAERAKRSTTVTSSTPTTPGGLPRPRCTTGRSDGSQADPSPRVRRSPRSFPCRRWRGWSVGRRGGRHRDATLSGVSEDPLPFMSPPRSQRLSEAADAVAAHLGPAAVSIEECHLCRASVGRLAHQQTISTDAAVTVAHVAPRPAGHRPRGTRRGSRCRVRGVCECERRRCCRHDRSRLGDRIGSDVDPAYAGRAGTIAAVAPRTGGSGRRSARRSRRAVGRRRRGQHPL